MPDFGLLRRRVYTAAKFAKRGISNPRYDTSDIAQESLLQLLKDITDTDLDDVNVNTRYLEQVSRGHARRLLRDNLAQRRSMSCEETIEFNQLLDRGYDPAELAQDQELVLNLIKAISQLEPDQQLIVYKRFFDQKSFADIARELEVQYIVVRRSYEKAITSLRRLLLAG